MNRNICINPKVILALALIGGVACDDDEDQNGVRYNTTSGSVAHFLATDGRFQVFTELAFQVGLLEELDDPSANVTLFVPTDSAFNRLPDSFMVTQNFVSTGDPEQLTLNLTFDGRSLLIQGHIADDTFTAAEVGQATVIETQAGEDISVQVFDPTPANNFGELDDEFVILGDRAQVIEADQSFENGTIHVLDTVLMPTNALAEAGEIGEDAFPGTLFELLEATPLYSDYLGALRAAELGDRLAELDDADEEQTIFLPLTGLDTSTIADVPASALANILDLHIIPGAQVASALTEAGVAENHFAAQFDVDGDAGTIEGREIVATDITASNGVVHVLRNRIPRPTQTVADMLTTDRLYSTFVSLLNPTATSTVDEPAPTALDELRDENLEITVFAPTNAAFENLDGLGYDFDSDSETGLLAELTAAETVVSVLQYHLADAIVDLFSDESAPVEVVSTRLGDTIAVGILGDELVLNELIGVFAPVQPSENASLIYPLGNVLLPESVLNGEVRPQVSFPGPTAQALAYFPVLSGFTEGAEATNVPYLADVNGGTTTIFGGTLLDIMSFVEPADPTNVLEAPFAVDTDEDGTLDANVSIPEHTVFVPLNASVPENPDEFVFDADIENYVSGDVYPYHVIFGKGLPIEAGEFETVTVADAEGALGKFSLSVASDEAGVIINDQANVIYPALETINGVIYIIDGILTP